MPTPLFRRKILPFVLYFVLLIGLTLLADWLLHRYQAAWVGRYLGIPGVLLILLSFGYSLRKRKLIGRGNPKTLLRAHELMAWVGTLMVLVHAGVHYANILPWLAVGAMLVNIASGLTGKYLLERSRQHVEARRAGLAAGGFDPDEVERRLFWDAATVEAMKKWRAVHFPITFAFGVLAVAHLLTVFLFWPWR
jgi:hypothetical protein